jgi:hypothetical protein
MCAQREEEYDRKENIILGSNSMGIIYRKHDPWKLKSVTKNIETGKEQNN